jgi:hypothetical protein
MTICSVFENLMPEAEFLDVIGTKVLRVFLLAIHSHLYTVMPLRCITVALFPVWKWDRGQVLFNAEEI